MDSVAKAATYFGDPVVLIGLTLFVVGLTTRQLSKVGIIHAFSDSSPFWARSRGFVFLLGVVIIGTGAYLKHNELSNVSTQVADQNTNNSAPSEVDYGFAELNPDQPTPVLSYKYGENMVLYAGDEFRFQTLGDDETTTIELHTGNDVQLLPGLEGKLTVLGPANKPLSAVLFAKGSRVSLPGGAPPRLSVKVQVFGLARPK